MLLLLFALFFTEMLSKKISITIKNKLFTKFNLRTPNQIKYYNFLSNPNMPVVVGFGPAGTGKTLLACITAINNYESNMIDNIILTRPIVEVGEKLGYLPGNIND
jgi:phosphate starvation-inducible PhoH-like protein